MCGDGTGTVGTFTEGGKVCLDTVGSSGSGSGSTTLGSTVPVPGAANTLRIVLSRGCLPSPHLYRSIDYKTKRLDF